ncbi:MAG: serine--tRNA ligase [Planctomycetota bacterium]
MLDIRFLRENVDLVREGAKQKRIACDVDGAVAADARRREITPLVDELRSRQKAAGKAIANASPDERERLLAEQRGLKEELKALEEELSREEERMQTLLASIPNPPAAEVPLGKDDSENVELRTWGTPREFDFEPADHIALALAQGWMDVEVGARIAGSRNYVLIGDLARLENAVLSFALDHMLAKGFTPVSVPVLVRYEPLFGTGYFPGGEDQTYRTDERDELYLAGTAEVPVTAIHAGEILDESRLPIRYVARSACYRREAGAYGKDTRGLYRVHQFFKVEQVVIDRDDEELSRQHQSAILTNSEELLQAFDLPYRVVDVCAGDLGAPPVQKFDLETWMPSRGGYGETHSASRFHTYQSRRLNLRYRDSEGKVRFCHTLNNTVAASARLLLALLENHQRADGTVRVPPVLQPYMGGASTIGSAR